ncbi:MAG: tetratricopeptide repeat protein, partial [Blastocatellia bacterium]
SEGYGVFKQLVDQPRVAGEAKDIVSYRWGEALQSARDFSGALAQYRQVVEWAASDYDMITQAHLHAGEMLDCLNNRSEALAEYQRVLSRRNIYDCQDQARDHIKHPYRPK